MAGTSLSIAFCYALGQFYPYELLPATQSHIFQTPGGHGLAHHYKPGGPQWGRLPRGCTQGCEQGRALKVSLKPPQEAQAPALGKGPPAPARASQDV